MLPSYDRMPAILAHLSAREDRAPMHFLKARLGIAEVPLLKGGNGSGWRSPEHGGTHVKRAPHEDGKDGGGSVIGIPLMADSADFIKSPGGSIDFGEITAEQAKVMRRQAGKIRLERGVQNSDGTGYGLVHIEANHGKQIRGAGFGGVEEFVAHVATRFNEILQASGRQLLVAIEGDRQDVMFIQLEPAGDADYYRINSAFPASRDYLEKQQRKGMKLLWGGSEPASPVAGQQALYAGTPKGDSGQGAPIAQGQSSSPRIAPTDNHVKSTDGPIAKAMPRLILFLKGGRRGGTGLHEQIVTGKDGIARRQWVRLPGHRKVAHNGAQSELFTVDGTPYQSLETRPGTTAKQMSAGMDAIAALERRVHLLRDNRGSTATLLGARLLAGFVAAGGNQLTGQSVKSPADLAALAQVYRDPRFETFRCIFLKDGVVVGESAYSSRLPGAVRLPKDFGEQISRDTGTFGADGYYILHNHPSGRATPSSSDIGLTRHTAANAPGFRGHVVVDHKEYATIDSDGETAVVQAPELSGVDFHATPAKDHPLLGTSIFGPELLAIAAKALKAYGELEAPVLIQTKGQDSKVGLIASVPMGLVRQMGERTARAMAWVRGIGRGSGAGAHAFIVVSPYDYDQNKSHLKALVADGVLTDVVSSEGRSIRKNDGVFFSSRAGPFEPRGEGRKAAEPQRLADDLAAQEQYLTAGAKDLGYGSIDELATENYPAFERLAIAWRERHRVEDALYEPGADYQAGVRYEQ